MNQTQAQRRFGTFSGVFTPSILTIFGVIMFLRTGFLVGNAGVINGAIIILISEVIVFLTALSISAIATNVEVKVGGAYFLISRSLGVEFGGAIGLVLFLSQAVSVAFYIVGFTEAFMAAFPNLSLGSKAISTIVCTVLFITTYIGAGWAIKMQFLILSALGISILSFIIGAVSGFDMDLLRANIPPGYIEGYSFWKTFAIFFPAVTGILAGVNMSGDLKDPQRNIPRGTLYAISISTVVYVLVAFLLAGNFRREILVTDSTVMRLRSVIPFSLNLGVFAATLSSALGSFVAAPRVLQALAGDEIFRHLRVFAKGGGRTNEPRRGVLLTLLITEAGILMGDLNFIAPIITMFFMITYGTLNFATLYETIAGNPSFRPRFRYFHWSTALLGALGCLGIMMLIDMPYAILSLLLLFIIYKYVERRAIVTTWGDATAGFLFWRTRQNLLKMDREIWHPKNWRPSILVMTGNPHQRFKLVQFARWLEAGKGIIILGNVLQGDLKEMIVQKRTQEEVLRRFIEEHNLEAFHEVIVAGDFESGVVSLIQSAGVGRLKPNTVIFGFSYDPERYEIFGRVLRNTVLLGKNVVVVKPDLKGRKGKRIIDVWWRGKENGALMMLLAHLIRLNPEWRDCRKRILRLVPEEGEREEAFEELRDLIYRARVEAEPQVIVSEEPFPQVMRRTSANSSLIFLGLSVPEEGEEVKFMRDISSALEGTPTVLLVKSVLGEDVILS